MSDDEQSEEECREAIKAESASCVSIEESIEANMASGFLFCEDHVSDISPHLDIPLHDSGSIQQSLNVSENGDIGSDCFELHDLTSATLGMVGGIAGSGLFSLGCIALVGVGWTVAAASVGSLALGGLSGSAVGARRNSGPDAFLSGALAGFVGLTATTAFLGGELVVEACSDASEVED
jgi:hypothetical protein